MYDQVAQNKRRSLAVTAIFVLFTAAVVAVVLYLFDFGIVGVVIAAVVAVGSAGLSWWKSDAVALRMARAVPADPQEHAGAHAVARTAAELATLLF